MIVQTQFLSLHRELSLDIKSRGWWSAAQEAPRGPALRLSEGSAAQDSTDIYFLAEGGGGAMGLVLERKKERIAQSALSAGSERAQAALLL